MNTRSAAGFTIIETMLFLAISGALAAAILAGSSMSIAQQRYRDAGSSLQSFFQRQYADVSNVINDRDNNWTCDTANGTVSPKTGGDIAGASDCVIMGKLLTIGNGGQTITSSNVIGGQTKSGAVTNDIEAFQQYALTWTSVGQEVKKIDWGASLVPPNGVGGSLDGRTILILRSPFSGIMRTFTPPDYHPSESPGSIPTNIALATFNAKQTFCINSSDFGIFQRLAIIMRAGATGPSSVELSGSEGSEC